VPGTGALRKLTAETMDGLRESFKLQTYRDLAELTKDRGAVFDPVPAIDGNGRLILKGLYPVKMNKLIFELSYKLDNAKWNLVESKVNYVITPPTR